MKKIIALCAQKKQTAAVVANAFSVIVQEYSSLTTHFSSAYRKFSGITLLCISTALLSQNALAQSITLNEVKSRGVLLCGVSNGLPGFAKANSLGEYAGLDVDMCRAVAVSIFNDADAVEFRQVTSADRFNALKAGQFDMLSRNTTWTMSRNVQHGEFVGVNYYDGQGFMVPKKSGIRSALELNNKKVCVIKGTTTELNAIDFFKVSKMRYRPLFVDTQGEASAAYLAGKCAVITTDRSGLAGIRSGFPQPDAHVVLPEVISKEPLGPVVRAGDSAWANVVRWSLNCMINAEELGIQSDNLSQAIANANPATKRLLGLEGDFGQLLGLDNSWCANIIREVGNYAESYNRNVGPDTALGLVRGVNSLWTDGGLLYAPPIR